MRRTTLALAAALLMSMTLVPGVAAQDGPVLSVHCVTIAGEPPAGGWDEFSLQEAIASGSAQVVLVAAPEECEQVTRETVVADEADSAERLTLEVMETAVFTTNVGPKYTVLVANPNADRWAAQVLPVAVQVLNDAGEEIEFTHTSISLLPDQTSATVGLITALDDPDRVEVVLEDSDFYWLPTEVPADVLVISGVEKEEDPVLGFATTGTVRNSSETTREGATLVAIHRDGAGSIIGADFTWLESIEPGEEVEFEILNISGIGLDEVASTEVLYQLITVPPA